MILRRLELTDAPLMLSWMHDKDIVGELKNNFSEKKLNDCEAFIRDSWSVKDNLHLAVASDDNTYMGTVSLKNLELSYAEFGIVVRKEAMGQGYAWFGMQNILRIAFTDLNLNSVYWCVSRDNVRALKFYKKHGFYEIGNVPKKIKDLYKNADNLKWFEVQKDGIAIT